jgi:hypothetical protein
MICFCALCQEFECWHEKADSFTAVTDAHAAPIHVRACAGPNVGFVLIKAMSTQVQEAPNVEVMTNTKVGRLHLQQQLCC